jgi:hypothetical protein
MQNTKSSNAKEVHPVKSAKPNTSRAIAPLIAPSVQDNIRKNNKSFILINGVLTPAPLYQVSSEENNVESDNYDKLLSDFMKEVESKQNKGRGSQAVEALHFPPIKGANEVYPERKNLPDNILKQGNNSETPAKSKPGQLEPSHLQSILKHGNENNKSETSRVQFSTSSQIATFDETSHTVKKLNPIKTKTGEGVGVRMR